MGGRTGLGSNRHQIARFVQQRQSGATYGNRLRQLTACLKWNRFLKTRKNKKKKKKTLQLRCAFFSRQSQPSAQQIWIRQIVSHLCRKVAKGQNLDRRVWVSFRGIWGLQPFEFNKRSIWTAIFLKKKNTVPSFLILKMPWISYLCPFGHQMKGRKLERFQKFTFTSRWFSWRNRHYVLFT